jgi:alginate O-acetyltransferase complex protein AlgI
MLLISILFCGLCSLKFLWFILFFTLWNYVFGLAVEDCKQKSIGSAVITLLGISGDVITLILYRTELMGVFVRNMKEMSAVGISFFTLSAIGYLIDIYCGRIKAEHNPVKFALFIMFFPKLPFGSLISYSSFRRMCRNPRHNITEVGTGIGIFITGLGKKVIFADTLYNLYSAVNSMDVSDISAVSSWLGIISYMLCLYFTLSGYSDMGIGIARCFGYRLPRSFRYPVFGMGMRDFCAKWHMPLIRWIKKYIVNPSVSRLSGKKSRIISAVAVWGLAGLWYGFNVNTLIWGLIIGTVLAFEIIMEKKTLKATAIIYTFIINSIGIIFFFGDGISYSMRYLIASIGGNSGIADNVSLYLLKSYAVPLIVSSYAATDMFGNLIENLKKFRIKNIVQILSPVFTLAVLIICTAMISYSGSSDMILLNL